MFTATRRNKVVPHFAAGRQTNLSVLSYFKVPTKKIRSEPIDGAGPQFDRPTRMETDEARSTNSLAKA